MVQLLYKIFSHILETQISTTNIGIETKDVKTCVYKQICIEMVTVIYLLLSELGRRKKEICTCEWLSNMWSIQISRQWAVSTNDSADNKGKYTEAI